MKRWIWLPVIGGSIVLIIVVAWIPWQQQSQPPPPPPPKKLPTIRVEVLNGCGVSGIANRVGERLREKGFDVLTLDNAENFNYPETLVMDRVGKPDYAHLVADVLGTPNCIQQMTPDPFRIEEVTVVIGHDHARLPILQK